jgi:protein-disulfide isomerase
MAKKNAKTGKAAVAQMTAAQRRAKQEAARESQARWERTKRILIAVSVVVGVVIVAVVVMAVVNQSKTNDNNNAISPSASVTPITPPDATSDGMAIVSDPAASSAPLTLALHVDYQCPICKEVEQAIAQPLEQLESQNQVLVEYHIRSFLDGSLGNTSSTQAAIAATCADTVGKFQAYNDVVFANQPTKEGTGYTDDQLGNTFATQAGMTGDDLATFQQCYNDKATASFVSTMESKNLTTPIPGTADFTSGVKGTPALIVNGKEASYSDAMQAATSADSLLAYLQQVANS